MISASPTILALETDSAWVVILTVSVVTLCACLFLRRLISRPGGLASGLLLCLPLVLPLVAAVAYAQAVLPEVAVLRPANPALLASAKDLLQHLLLIPSAGNHTVMPFALAGRAGPWIFVIGLSVSSFMLLRRAFGAVMVGRLVRSSRSLHDGESHMSATVARLARVAGMKHVPEVLVLPVGASGAFAVGARRPRILVSADLMEYLDDEELEAIVAHEVAHLQARDVEVVFAAGLLRDVVAWNPFAHLAFRRLLIDRELEADRRAATMTGEPLAVASGLLKMCDLIKRNGRARHRAALAFLGPGTRLTRRVANLIALADGRTALRSARVLPYLFAACAVAALGLQAGARVASHGGGGFAIVVGTPDAASAGLWRPKEYQPFEKSSIGGVDRARGTRQATIAQLLRDPELAGTVSLRQKDVPVWLKAMRKVARSIGAASALEWKLKQNWRAEPLLDPLPGSIGIFRVSPQAI